MFPCPLAIFQCPLAPFSAVSCNQEGCKKWALNLSQFMEISYICYFSMITNIILPLNTSFKKPVNYIFGEWFARQFFDTFLCPRRKPKPIGSSVSRPRGKPKQIRHF